MVCHGFHWGVWVPKSHIESMDFFCAVYIGLDSSISLASFWGMALPSSMTREENVANKEVVEAAIVVV